MPSDYGHEYADKELKKLERKLTKEYQQAATELEKKFKKYLEDFAEKDSKMRSKVASGEMSAQDYATWRQNQIMVGNRWKEMSEQLSEDLANVDKIAAGMINDSLPLAYAENFNYGVYEVEMGAKIDTAFTLYDRKTVENLMKDDPKIIPQAKVDIPKDQLWNRKKLTSAVTQGILQGESINKIAKRLASVADMDRKAAIRNARTYTTAAENKGRIDSYDRAKDMGINVKKEWLATLDERTRMEHRHLDGMAVDNDEPFEVDGYTIMYPGDPSAEPEMIYNCFIGDTSAYTNCDVIRSYAHQYDGDLIEIKTASGVNFTCTPNHPILTLNGWVSAASLHNGDDLLVTRIGNKFGFGRYCNIQHVFSSMKAFHDSFKRNGTIERNAALCVNFHGDIPTSEVEIVTQKRFLSNNGYPSFCESIKKFLLKLSDKTLFCKCTFMEHFRSVWLSTLGDIRSRSKLLSFLKRHLGHSEVHRLRPIALFDASGVKPLQNDVSGNIERISDCLNGFSGIVFADNIVNVNISSRCTHVYNLQTENGYYFVNSIISQKNKRCNGIVAISHNCRCTLVARIVDYKYNDERNDSKLGDMTYEEWKHAKDRTPVELSKEEKRITKPEIPENVRKEIDRFEEKFRNANKENYMAIDKDGNVIFESSGKERKVTVPKYVDEKMEGGYSIHNHPVDATFSVADIRNYEKYGENGIITDINGYESILYNTNPVAKFKEVDKAETNEEYERLMPFSSAAYKAFSEIDDDVTERRREYSKELLQTEPDSVTRAKLLNEWMQENDTEIRKREWLEENAEKYGFIYIRRKIGD